VHQPRTVLQRIKEAFDWVGDRQREA